MALALRLKTHGKHVVDGQKGKTRCKHVVMYVVNTCWWTRSGKHVANTWQICGKQVTQARNGKQVTNTWYTLKTRGKHLAWARNSKHVANMLQTRGKHVANTWQWKTRGKHVFCPSSRSLYTTYVCVHVCVCHCTVSLFTECSNHSINQSIVY